MIAICIFGLIHHNRFVFLIRIGNFIPLFAIVCTEKGKAMNKIEEKAIHFLTALLDVYRDEENRELEAFSKLELADDVTGDLTAMLLAIMVVLERLTGYDGDLIDFTHMLNKMAVQYIMDGERRTDNEID